jgi:hypothetical protein
VPSWFRLAGRDGAYQHKEFVSDDTPTPNQTEKAQETES